MLLVFLFSVCALTSADDTRLPNHDSIERVTADTEAIAAYKSLWTAADSDRRDMYRSLPSHVKASVWRVHLRQYLAAHPELDERQRAVIRDAMLLLKTEPFDVGIASPEFAELLRQLEEQAKRVFGIERARTLFGELGPEPIESNVCATQPRVDAQSLKPRPLQLGCTCSTISDLCSLPKVCEGGECTWRPDGCGIFWQYACTGLCYLH
jgi:hypothetical protein